jgi:hypothetical protein
MEEVIELTESQMHEIAGGQSSATFSFTNSASGPTSATVSGSLTQSTASVGGLAPSETAFQSGTFTASSS